MKQSMCVFLPILTFAVGALSQYTELTEESFIPDTDEAKLEQVVFMRMEMLSTMTQLNSHRNQDARLLVIEPRSGLDMEFILRRATNSMGKLLSMIPRCIYEGHSKMNAKETVLLIVCGKQGSLFHHGGHAYDVLTDLKPLMTAHPHFRPVRVVKRQAEGKPRRHKTTSRRSIKNLRRVRRAGDLDTITIETAVVVDAKFVANLEKVHGKQQTDEEIYDIVKLKFNGVQAELTRFRDIGLDIKVAIKEIDIWRTDPAWYSNDLSGFPGMCKGLFDNDKGTNYDYIYIISHNPNPASTERGWAGSMCKPKSHCGISFDYRLHEVYTPTHEIGHSLSLQNDQDAGCEEDQGIMGNFKYGWSNCSYKKLQTFLGSAASSCLTTKDIVTDAVLPLTPAWPGMLWTEDEMCEFQFGPGYRYKEFQTSNLMNNCTKKSCVNMNVTSPAYGVFHTDQTMTNGKYCGEGKVCSTEATTDEGYFKCITWEQTGLDQSFFKPVEGGWSAWGEMTTCSRTCGTGVKYRQRTCTNPKPVLRPTCEGDEFDAYLCNTDPCVNDPTNRAELINKRAEEYCTGIHNRGWFDPDGVPLDKYKNTGKLWQNLMGQCDITCDTAWEISAGISRRNGFLPDGTPCQTVDYELHSGINSFEDLIGGPVYSKKTFHCIQGRCQMFGCASNRVVDMCGVCAGDNSTCDFRVGETAVGNTVIGQESLLETLDEGMYNIHFSYDDSKMTGRFLRLYDKKTGTLVFNDSLISTNNPETPPVEFAGTVWHLDRRKQYLYAAGPVTRVLEVKLLRKIKGSGSCQVRSSYSTSKTTYTTTTGTPAPVHTTAQAPVLQATTKEIVNTTTQAHVLQATTKEIVNTTTQAPVEQIEEAYYYQLAYYADADPSTTTEGGSTEGGSTESGSTEGAGDASTEGGSTGGTRGTGDTTSATESTSTTASTTTARATMIVFDKEEQGSGIGITKPAWLTTVKDMTGWMTTPAWNWKAWHPWESPEIAIRKQKQKQISGENHDVSSASGHHEAGGVIHNIWRLVGWLLCLVVVTTNVIL